MPFDDNRMDLGESFNDKLSDHKDLNLGNNQKNNNVNEFDHKIFDDNNIEIFRDESNDENGLIKPCFREQIFLTLSEPSYSTFAYCLSFYFDSLVAISMVLMCAETVVEWSRTEGQRRMWRAAETLLTMNFLLDFLLKLFTGRPLLKLIMTRPTFTIDLLCLLPFFVEKIVEELYEDDRTSIKALRVLRLLRFFRLSRIAYENFPDVRMFIQAVRRSRLAIAFLGMYVFGAGLFFASCIYFAETSECYLDGEKGIWFYNNTLIPEPCSIQNMFGAWWYTLVTMTTVGYGDVIVTSSWGKIFTVFIMIGSLVFLALPSAIFAANLTEMYLERRIIKKMHGHTPIPASSPLQGQDPISGISEAEHLKKNADMEQVTATLANLSAQLSAIQQQQQILQNLLIDWNKTVNYGHDRSTQ